VTDRIDIVWSSDHLEVASAFDRHAGMISAEVLADSITQSFDGRGEEYDLGRATVILSAKLS